MGSSGGVSATIGGGPNSGYGGWASGCSGINEADSDSSASVGGLSSSSNIGGDGRSTVDCNIVGNDQLGSSGVHNVHGEDSSANLSATVDSSEGSGKRLASARGDQGIRERNGSARASVSGRGSWQSWSGGSAFVANRSWRREIDSGGCGIDHSDGVSSSRNSLALIGGSPSSSEGISSWARSLGVGIVFSEADENSVLASSSWVWLRELSGDASTLVSPIGRWIDQKRRSGLNSGSRDQEQKLSLNSDVGILPDVGDSSSSGQRVSVVIGLVSSVKSDLCRDSARCISISPGLSVVQIIVDNESHVVVSNNDGLESVQTVGFLIIITDVVPSGDKVVSGNEGNSGEIGIDDSISSRSWTSKRIPNVTSVAGSGVHISPIGSN